MFNFKNIYKHIRLESGKRDSEYVTDDPKDIPSLGGENIDEEGFLKLENIRYISKEGFDKLNKGIIEDKDIFINKDGANTGKMCFINKKPFETCAVNEHIFIIRNDGIFEQKYLFYYLLSKEGADKIKSRITGSAQGGINNSVFKGFLAPVPNMEEQKHIAYILDKTDEAIESTKKSIEKAQRLKKSLIQNLLTGKMKPDGTWRKDNEFYIDPKFGKVPKGWEVVKTKKLLVGSPSYGANASAEEYGKDKTRFVRITDIKDYNSMYADTVYVPNDIAKNYMLKNDDFLFARTGDTVGKSMLYKDSMGPCCYAGYLIRLQFDKTKILPEYYKFFANSLFFDKFKESIKRVGAKPNINGAEYGIFRIWLPLDLNEQKEIIDLFLGIDNKISLDEEKIDKLHRLKKSLMQHLLTGKIRIPENAFDLTK